MTSFPPISEIRQIRLLASAARQEIVDALEAAGPCSVRELATHLGRKPDALYYHIHLLRKAGLVVASDSEAGRAEVVVDVAYRPMSLAYEPSNARNRAAVTAVVATMLRSAQRRFARAFLPEIARVEGDSRNLWAGRAQGWLSADDVHSINQHMNAILAILRKRRKAPAGAQASGRSLVEFSFVLAPRVHRAKSRQRAQ